ncbi:hypothetical protein G3I76_72440, partial [Streptomyces sp. SID11233]|nr:hypothetical protein [Streptomyces sp. SID11233]
MPGADALGQRAGSQPEAEPLGGDASWTATSLGGLAGLPFGSGSGADGGDGSIGAALPWTGLGNPGTEREEKTVRAVASDADEARDVAADDANDGAIDGMERGAVT